MRKSKLGRALRAQFAEFRQIIPDLLLLLAFVGLYIALGVVILLSVIGATILLRGG